jgi:hypothetical protein
MIFKNLVRARERQQEREREREYFKLKIVFHDFRPLLILYQCYYFKNSIFPRITYSLVENQPTFRRNLSPASSGL